MTEPCTHPHSYLTVEKNRRRVCQSCGFQLYPQIRSIEKSPGSSWTECDGGWEWFYPRNDVEVRGFVSHAGEWHVTVDGKSTHLKSKKAARTLLQAGSQCWRAMCAASNLTPPESWTPARRALRLLGQALRRMA